MPAPKLPPEAKKDQKLQVSVDITTYGRFVALAEALGHEHVADFLRALVDDALANAKAKIEKRQEELSQSRAKEQRTFEELAAKALADPSLRASGDGI